MVAVVLRVARRWRACPPGYMLALYLALYSFGRFFVEGLRVDPAHELGPLRLNQVVAACVFAARWPRSSRCGDAAAAASPALSRAPELLRRRPSQAGRGGTITRTVQPPPSVCSNDIVPPTPQARSRIASTPRCMPPRMALVLARSAAVVGDHELDAALLGVRAVTSMRVPPACLTAFVVASCAMR